MAWRISLSNSSVLDNPIWHALTSGHGPIAIQIGSAARYPAEVSPLIGLADGSAEAFADLGKLLHGGKGGATFTAEPLAVPSEWTVRQRMIDQMVCNELRPFEALKIVRLEETDVPEMMALTAATEPGPFSPQTVSMGRYYGIRVEGGRLAAMAGERLNLGNLVEISAVCTHPQFRGKGFARSLVGQIAAQLFEEGKAPFLHVKTENGAKLTYEKLGFRVRRQMNLTIFAAGQAGH
jgi:GNAT superfamily N-acetyltransferase